MAEIILDIGSGRSLHNVMRAETMIAKVANTDSHKHKIIFKTQLFRDAPPNIPLDHDVFDHLYHYAASLGYPMTSSVFDKDSLAFLWRYQIPFVKIACRPDLYWLIGEIPRKMPVYVSVYDKVAPPYLNGKWLFCVPQYPAQISEYLAFSSEGRKMISDHSPGLDVWLNLKPDVWEKHLCPEREADNPDSGTFAVTPEELREVIA